MKVEVSLLPRQQLYPTDRVETLTLAFVSPAGENEMVIMRPGNKYEYKFGFELPQG